MLLAYFNIFPALMRLMPQTPYLIQHTAIAPHITCCWVLLVFNCFRSSPLHWNFASMRHVIIFIKEVPWHAKISNLYLTKKINNLAVQQESVQKSLYLACVVFRHQYVPCCQVSVHKPFLGQVLHSKANVPAELQQLLAQYGRIQLVYLSRAVATIWSV